MARQLGWESIEPQMMNLEYRSLQKEQGGHEALTLPCARTGMDNPPQVHGDQVSYDVEILSETPGAKCIDLCIRKGERSRQQEVEIRADSASHVVAFLLPRRHGWRNRPASRFKLRQACKNVGWKVALGVGWKIALEVGCEIGWKSNAWKYAGRFVGP